MKFGICAGPDLIKKDADYEIDYLESSVVGLNGLSDDEFEEFIIDLKQSPIKCEVLNILFPGTISVVGPAVDMDEIKAYLESSFARSSQAGVEIIIFGSGKARFCPEDFSKEKAMEQLCEVSYTIGEIAKKYGLFVALEPLNRSDTNMINTVDEGLALVQKVSHPNFKLLADIYHMLVNGESPECLLKCKEELIHTHIATKEGRKYPLNASEDDFSSFFKALKEIGYSARMSIEGKSDNQESESPIAMKCLRELDKSIN